MSVLQNRSSEVAFLPELFTNTSLEKEQLPKTIAYSVLFFVSMIGNFLIILVIHKDARLKTTNNFLIANMAVSDLLSTLFIVPLRISKFYFGNRWLIPGKIGLALCKVVSFVPDVSTSVSFYSCLFIAIDRYFAVADPLRGGFSRSRLKRIIPGIWIFSAAIVSPYFYFRYIAEATTGALVCLSDAYGGQIHRYILIALNVGVPFPIITTLYILIVYKLRRHKAPGRQHSITRRKRELQRRKVLKMSAVIVAVLYFCWIFVVIVIILHSLGKANEIPSITWANLEFSSMFIAHMSLTSNFFVYLFFNGMYRENFKAIVLTCCNRNHHSRKRNTLLTTTRSTTAQ